MGVGDFVGEDFDDEEATEVPHPHASFIDPGPDPMLTIPGEKVFARVNNSRLEHWPAIITGYVPSTVLRRQGKYNIMFFDRVNKKVDRSLFYTSLDDGFSTCKVTYFEIWGIIYVYDDCLLARGNPVLRTGR